jgi:hypothetical protein
MYDITENQEKVPPFKHLFFSSIVHASDGLGCYLTGGADEFSNFYRRVLFFDKYESYKIITNMIKN